MTGAFSLQLESFEGPLDLLLQLVERRQLDITRVALATVADQYLSYLRGLSQADLDAWSSFVYIGSRLVLLKSSQLLPAPPPAAEEAADADELVRLLEEYRRYKQVSEGLRRRWTAGRRAYPRPAPLTLPPRPPRLTNVTGADLARALQQVLARVEAGPAGAVARRTLTLPDRIARIQALLQTEPILTFTALMAECRTRAEIVVTFWALLELLKRGAVQAQQDTLFGEILIQPRGGPPAPAASATLI